MTSAGTGTRIGELAERFDALQVLRTGSQFTVWTGRDRVLDRVVAVKIPDESHPSWIHDSLRTQARVLADLAWHPHVVTLFDLLTLGDGRPALVLDRCGGSLADSLQLGARVTVQAATSLGIKIAGALDAVHRRGLLHCDVRPDNILITEDAEPVLAAFDEAVPTDPDTERFPQHVTTGHTAPELLEGAPPTPASDVYGLAATLYELIAGRAAFREYTGESAATMIVRVLSGQVRPIVTPGVPLEMSDLLTWAMAPDPERRPPSPAWLAEELGRIANAEGWPRTVMIAG